MRNISIPAIKVQQIGPADGNEKGIFVSAMPIKELLDEHEFKIDYWDPEKRNSPTQGYQRVPSQSHVTGVAKFAGETHAVFPTAVLLSIRKDGNGYSFDGGKNGVGTLSLKKPPFWIIDGQHRVLGLRHAVSENQDEKWLERELPVVVLVNFTREEEIALFNTVNSTQKRVDTSLAQQLLYMRSKSDKKFRESLVISGQDWKARAVALVDELNQKESSPWYQRIKYPNEKKGTHRIVGQNSVITSLKPLYVGGYFESTRNVDSTFEITANYWSALKKIFPGSFALPDESVIMKTPGLFTLHTLLRAILQRRGASKENVSTASFESLLKKVFKAAGKDDNFWNADNDTGASMYGSMKGFRLLADQFIAALDEVLETE